MAFVIDQHIEGLGIGSELIALQIAPLIANGAKLALLAVLLDGFHLGQRCLFIYKQGDEDKTVVHQLLYLGMRPYGGFHLAAVDTAVTREVKEDGLMMLTSVGHAFFVILKGPRVDGGW